MINNQTVSFSMINTGAATTQGRFSYVPTITIESEALNDPSLIDPTTGLPYNGSFTTGGSGAYLANKTMAPELPSLSPRATLVPTLPAFRNVFCGVGASQ
jgi:hypothetical protein